MDQVEESHLRVEAFELSFNRLTYGTFFEENTPTLEKILEDAETIYQFLVK